MQFRIHLALSILLTMIVVVVFSLGSVRAFPPVKFRISGEQAKEIVRKWIGDSDMQLRLAKVHLPEDARERPPHYVLRTADGNQIFWVDCFTGDVLLWRDIQAYKSLSKKKQWSSDGSRWKSVDEIESITRHFVISKYPSFMNLNMQIIYLDLHGSGYCQRLKNGVMFLGNMAALNVDPWTGKVVFYIAWYNNSPSVSTLYTVTCHQAERNALTYAVAQKFVEDSDRPETTYAHPKSVFVLKNHGVRVFADDLGSERIGWFIDVIISMESNYTLEKYYRERQNEYFSGGMHFTIVVDANTGSIISDDQTLEPPIPVVAPIITVQGDSIKTATISCAYKLGANIYYTTDGSDPTGYSKLYVKPFAVKTGTILKARAYSQDYLPSSIVTVICK